MLFNNYENVEPQVFIDHKKLELGFVSGSVTLSVVFQGSVTCYFFSEWTLSRARF